MGGWSGRVSHGTEGFFDVERRLEAISAKGDPLETIKKIVPWEDFRADIEAVTETKPEERRSNAGRKHFRMLCVTSTFRLRRCATIREMKEGPSRSVIRC
jgi:hypothetical protein